MSFKKLLREYITVSVRLWHRICNWASQQIVIIIIKSLVPHASQIQNYNLQTITAGINLFLCDQAQKQTMELIAVKVIFLWKRQYAHRLAVTICTWFVLCSLKAYLIMSSHPRSPLLFLNRAQTTNCIWWPLGITMVRGGLSANNYYHVRQRCEVIAHSLCCLLPTSGML